MSTKQSSIKIEACIEEILLLQEPNDKEIAKINRAIAKMNVEKEELKRKNYVIIENACKKHEVNKFHINTILKAQTKGAI